MKPVISRLVSIYGIHWDIYQMLIVKLRNSMPRNTLFGRKMGVKITICTCNVRETPKTHMKPYISWFVSIYGIRWDIYHMLLVKLRKLYCQETSYLGQKWGSKLLFAPVMSEKQLKHIWNLILAGLYQFMEYAGISSTCC